MRSDSDLKGEKMKKKAIIVDVDLTLVGDTHFDADQQYDREYLRNWHLRAYKAESLPVGLNLVRLFHEAGYALIVMTARDTTGRQLLQKRLREENLLHMIDKIMLRKMREQSLPSSVVKQRMINDCADKYHFVYAIDDSNHQMFRENGIIVVDSNQWNKRAEEQS